MYHIRLIKGRSYTGAVSATKTKPDVYTEDEATAKQAVASGFFTLVEVKADADSAPSGESTEETAADEAAADYEGLEDMTKAELTEYAEKNGISLEGCSTKAQILEAINAAAAAQE